MYKNTRCSGERSASFAQQLKHFFHSDKRDKGIREGFYNTHQISTMGQSYSVTAPAVFYKGDGKSCCVEISTRHALPRNPHSLVSVFKTMDKDNSGTIERLELYGYLRNTCNIKGMTNPQLDEMFSTADTNADGRINWREFVAVMKLAKNSSFFSSAGPRWKELWSKLESEETEAVTLELLHNTTDNVVATIPLAGNGTTSNTAYVPDHYFRDGQRYYFRLRDASSESLFSSFSGKLLDTSSSFSVVDSGLEEARRRRREEQRKQRIAAERARRQLEEQQRRDRQATRVLGDVFAEMDHDGNGSIEVLELYRYIRNHGVTGMTTAQLNSIFNEADSDFDGSITFSEFCDVMMKAKAFNTSPEWRKLWNGVASKVGTGRPKRQRVY